MSFIKLEECDNDRISKLYNSNAKEIKCSFCQDTHDLSDEENEKCLTTNIQYICPICEDKMKKKYEYGWWSFVGLRVARKSKLIESLLKKHKIINENFLYDLNKALSKPCPLCQKYHTPRDYISKFHICVDCVKTLPGYKEWKENNNKSLVIDVCEKHGFYVTGQLNKNHRRCPKCVEKAKTVNCEICGKIYISRDHHLERIKSGKTHNICDKCCKNLDGYDGFDKNKNLVWCDNCKKFVFTSHNMKPCPVCNKSIMRYNIKCKKCGKDSIVDNSARVYCKDCYEDLTTSQAVKDFRKMKESPFFKIHPNGLATLPIRSFKDPDKKYNIVKTCQHCGRLYIAHGSTSQYCGDCFQIVECDNCNEKYLVQPSKYYRNIRENGNWKGCCSQGCASSYAGKKRWEKGIVNAPGGYTPNYEEVGYKNVEYKNLKIEINESNIYDYASIGGVWYREDEYGNLLQVSETMDIFTEWYGVQQIIDSIISGEYPYNCSYAQMQKDGIDLSKTKTFILVLTEDRGERFDVEAHYAIENKAKYWKPAPGYQTKMIYSSDKNNINSNNNN